MTCPVSSIRFCTYNCRGWRSGSDYVSALLNSLDFCLIQEHWLLTEHLGALDISDEFISIGVSGMDSSNLLLGRPYGGCAILCRKTFSSSLHMVNSCSKRFCAVTLSSINPVTNCTFNTLIINAYLPTDYGTPDSNNAYIEAVTELDGFLLSQSYDNLLICGDLNVDFTRGGHNCSQLKDFMREYNLVCVDANTSIKYTYRRDDHSSFSWPDHILTLSHTAHLVNNIACTDSVDNFSDHLPLSFNLTTNHPVTPNAPPCSQTSTSIDSFHTVDWDKVTDDESIRYCDYVRDQLPVIPDEIVSCCNPACSTHAVDLDTLCLQLLSCLEEGARHCLPKIRSKRPAVPGWNIHARTLQKQLDFGISSGVNVAVHLQASCSS